MTRPEPLCYYRRIIASAARAPDAVLAAEGGDRHTAKLCLAAQCVAAIVRDPIKVDAVGAVTDSSDRLKALEPLAAQWRAIEAQRAAAATVTPSQARPASVSVRARGAW